LSTGSNIHLGQAAHEVVADSGMQVLAKLYSIWVTNQHCFHHTIVMIIAICRHAHGDVFFV
jgi:hypothetical protein